ncbi:MAG: hypothetical protein RLZZ627_1886, partial [Pseudomonadota bacterium]
MLSFFKFRAVVAPILAGVFVLTQSG